MRRKAGVMIDPKRPFIYEPWKETKDVRVEKNGSRIKLTFDQVDCSCRGTIVVEMEPTVYWKLLAFLLLNKEAMERLS